MHHASCITQVRGVYDGQPAALFVDARLRRLPHLRGVAAEMASHASTQAVALAGLSRAAVVCCGPDSKPSAIVMCLERRPGHAYAADERSIQQVIHELNTRGAEITDMNAQ